MLFSKKNDSVNHDSVDYQFFVAVIAVDRLNRPFRAEIGLVVYPGLPPGARLNRPLGACLRFVAVTPGWRSPRV